MSECKHENWQIIGSEPLGLGTCNDCGKEINLKVLFNNLKDRMVEAIRCTVALREKNV